MKKKVIFKNEKKLLKKVKFIIVKKIEKRLKNYLF